MGRRHAASSDGFGGLDGLDGFLARREEGERAVVASSSGAFTMCVGAVATHALGLALRAGCGTAVGAVAAAGAATASAALAGRVARASVETYDRELGGGKRPGKRRTSRGGVFVADADEGEVARDVSVGVAALVALSRGNLSRLLPSDVSRVGANATKSIAARGSDYASESQKRALQRWFKRFGCHHCGSTRGKVIGDHMPPNKVAFGSGARAAANRGASLPRRVFNFIRGVPLQRFYPQCESCSALQSVAVRSGVTKLVAHSVGVRYAALAGAAVGISTLHYDEIKTWAENAFASARRIVRA